MRVPGGVRDEEKEEERAIEEKEEEGGNKKSKVQGRVRRRIWVRFIESAGNSSSAKSCQYNKALMVSF